MKKNGNKAIVLTVQMSTQCKSHSYGLNMFPKHYPALFGVVGQFMSEAEMC